MSTGMFVLLSGSLSFGVPIALALRELLLLRDGFDGNRRDPVPPAPSPRPSGMDAVRKPLPDCLIPKPAVRVPELVD